MFLQKVVAVCLLAFCVSTAYAQNDWSMPRHDARNTAFTLQEIRPPLKQLWRVPTYSQPKPLLASGEVICVGNGAKIPELLLIDRTGKTRWRLPNADPLYLKGDTLIVLRKEEQKSSLLCLNWKTRATVWTSPLDTDLNYYTARVVVSTGRLYFAANMFVEHEEINRLMAFDLQTGERLAVFSAKENSGGQFVVDGSKIYWKLGHSGYILEAQTLNLLRQYNSGGAINPLVVGDLILSQQGMQVYATDRTSKKDVWSHDAHSETAHALVAGKRSQWVIVESLPPKGILAGIDVQSGKILWRYSLVVGGRQIGSIGGMAAGSGSLVYVPGWREHPADGGKMRGGFYCFDGATGKLLWQQEQEGSQGTSIIVSEGSVYGVDNKGFLSRWISR